MLTPSLPLPRQTFLTLICAAGLMISPQGAAKASQKPAQNTLLEQPAADADGTAWFKWYEQEAKRGGIAALGRLGSYYCLGTVVEKDEARGREMVHEAASKGDASARLAFGLMHRDGTCGVAKDAEAGIPWIRKGAEQGDAANQYFLGLAYQYGTGVAEDARQALHWHEKSAGQGYRPAKNSIAVLLITDDRVPLDDKRAVRLLRENVAQKDLIGQVHLGQMYRQGLLRDGDHILTPKSVVAAYALYSAQQPPHGTPVDVQLARNQREKLELELSPLQQWAGRRLAEKMLQAGDTLEVLDEYIEYERPWSEREPVKAADPGQAAQAVIGEAAKPENAAEALAAIKSKFGGAAQTNGGDRPDDALAGRSVWHIAERQSLPGIKILNYVRDNGWLTAQTPMTYRVEYTYDYVLTQDLPDAVAGLARTIVEEALADSPDTRASDFKEIESSARRWKNGLGDEYDYRLIAMNAHCSSCEDYWFRDWPEDVKPYLEAVFIGSWRAFLKLEFPDSATVGDKVARRAYMHFIKKEKGWDPVW